MTRINSCTPAADTDRAPARASAIPAPLISVVTVCFNSAQHIGAALSSVDSQSMTDWEHLVVDGASCDDTLGVVATYQHAARRVVSEPDKGIYDAMNKGLHLARGEVIGYLNSDDFYPSPDVLAQVAAAFADPDVDAVYGDLCYVRQNQPESIVRYWRSSPFKPGMFSRAWCPPHPTMFIRRSVYERLGGYNIQFPIAADMELMSRYLEVHRIHARYIGQVLVHMRMGGTTNKSLKNILQQNREIWRALAIHHLNPSLPSFVLHKLMARACQFLGRPPT